MHYINFERAEEADFTVGSHRYTAFAHDWRVEPFEMWWDQLCERSLSTEPVDEEAAPPQAPSIVVLSEPEFATYVRQALRDYTRPAALATNPLVRSRLVADSAGNGGDAARPQAVLRGALETLKPSPKDEKFYRALLYTFFQPAATQEGAAERLGLPFSTYRYHRPRHGTDRRVAVGARAVWQSIVAVRRPSVALVRHLSEERFDIAGDSAHSTVTYPICGLSAIELRVKTPLPCPSSWPDSFTSSDSARNRRLPPCSRRPTARSSPLDTGRAK